MKDSLGGFTIPERRRLAKSFPTSQGALKVGSKLLHAGQTIAANGNCNRSFRIGSQREAGSSEESAFILQTTGISQHTARMPRERNGVCVTDRIEKFHPGFGEE